MTKKSTYDISYAKKHIKRIVLALNVKTDAVLINHLSKIKNKSQYIKDLIKKDMKF